MSQTQKVLAVLESRRGEFVPMPELVMAMSPTGIGVAVHSRINDLRQKFGLTVEHRQERVNGQVHSFYRIPVGVHCDLLLEDIDRT